jgi:ABC-2 type transport system ATP-binding protein
LILDEPASGLDPRARIEIRSLLLELQNMGKSILISSHILADLGEICSRIGIIEKGHLLVDGELDEVLGMVKPSQLIYVSVRENDELALDTLRALPFVTEATQQKDTLIANVIEGFDEVWKLSKALTDAGLKLDYIEQESESLERSFIELTEGSVS